MIDATDGGAVIYGNLGSTLGSIRSCAELHMHCVEWVIVQKTGISSSATSILLTWKLIFSAWTSIFADAKLIFSVWTSIFADAKPIFSVWTSIFADAKLIFSAWKGVLSAKTFGILAFRRSVTRSESRNFCAARRPNTN